MSKIKTDELVTVKGVL